MKYSFSSVVLAVSSPYCVYLYVSVGASVPVFSSNCRYASSGIVCQVNTGSICHCNVLGLFRHYAASGN